jgi:hypothetical protein
MSDGCLGYKQDLPQIITSPSPPLTGMGIAKKGGSGEEK